MTQTDWIVRRATLDDLTTLVDFNQGCARDSEGKSLDPATLTRGVRRGLEQGDECVYLLATNDSGPLGQIMMTREWSDWRDGWIAWIQSVYVRPEHRGRGVFRSLLDAAVQRLRSMPDVIGVRLYVEAENSRAQEVYLHSGFSDARYQVFELMFTTADCGRSDSDTSDCNVVRDES